MVYRSVLRRMGSVVSLAETEGFRGGVIPLFAGAGDDEAIVGMACEMAGSPEP